MTAEMWMILGYVLGFAQGILFGWCVWRRPHLKYSSEYKYTRGGSIM